MKHLKLLVVFLSLVSLIAAIVLLYRRTNILLSHFDNLNRDVVSIKGFLTKNVRPPVVRSVGGGVKVPSGPTEVLRNNVSYKKEISEKNVNDVNQHDKIKNTQHNIEKLRESIEQIEDMMSSSSGYESEDADDESDKEVGVLEETPILLEESGVKVSNNNVESYDLADIEDENSELEDLINASEQRDEEDIIESMSTISNPQESNELNGKSITEEVTVDIILNSYSKKDLENLCAAEYLSKSGNKSVLVQRLLDNGYNFSQNNNNTGEVVVTDN